MTEHEPSVYIVGGLPRTGKSTVADRLARDLRISSMETDHIRMLFRATPTSKIRSDSNLDIAVVTKKLRPRLDCLIESIINGGSSIVINGECIDPHMITESPFRDQIRGCFIGLDDAGQAYDRIRSKTTPNDWTLHTSDDDLKDILNKYARRSQALAKTCLELGLPYFDASNDFMETHEKAYELMTQSDPEMQNA